MNIKTKHWIRAARLNTLPLSVSGIIVGILYSYANVVEKSLFNWNLFLLAILTTLGLQILSNFANDYGDGIKGTDNSNRVGPERALQSGVISASEMKKAIVITAFLTLLVAVLLIYTAFDTSYVYFSLFFLALGIAAIMAAIKYTVGKSAYGYKGFGDIFVFVFFGLISTLGSSFLYSKQFYFPLLLPGAAIGLLSVGVLNLNNMRDEASDRESDKKTLVVIMGGRIAKWYHFGLVGTALILLLVFGITYNTVGFKLEQYAFLVAYFPVFAHLKSVYNCPNPKVLNPQLKKLAISTFLVSLILALGLLF
jgi:1,4-dihydroxy-2-naphthoate octaprenyltransferase